MYIATVALSACGGCENSLLSIGEPLIALLSEHTVSFQAFWWIGTRCPLAT